mgnify:FL=1
MALTDIQKVRVEVADVDAALPILPDSTYEYLLEKQNYSIPRSAMDACRIILMTLAQRTDESVDLFSIKGSKASAEYREALKIYLKDPYNNPVLQNCQLWVGGVSLSEMEANDQDPDTNNIFRPTESEQKPTYFVF